MPYHLLKLACIFSVIFCSHSALAIQRSPWSFGADLLLLSDDNIGRSQHSEDIEKDLINTLSFNGKYTWSINQTKAISLGAFAKSENYQDFDGLSNQQYGLQLKYRFKTTYRFTSPLYTLLLETQQGSFDTNNRDGNTTRLGFEYLQYLTDRVAIAAGVHLSQRNAKSNVFDLEQTRIFVNADYTINRRTTFYISYKYLSGDTYSVATANDTIFNWADAVELDPAFTQSSYSYSSSGNTQNPDPYGNDPSYGSPTNLTQNETVQTKYAYRLKADTQLFRLGINIGINRNNSIDISADRIDSDAAGPIDYQTTMVALNYLHRF